MKNKSIYSIDSNLSKELKDNLNESFSKRDRQGFDLIDVKYADDVWFSAYGDNIGYPSSRLGETGYYFNPNGINAFLSEVEDFSRDGKKLYVTDVEYGDGTWLGVLDTGIVDSKIITANSFASLSSKIQKSTSGNTLTSGYRVVDIEYGNKTWLGVLEDTFGKSDFKIDTTFIGLEQEVRQQRKRGLELTNLEYVDGDYISVFTGTDKLTGMSIYSPETHARRSDFEAEIQDFRDDGYHLINIESIEGEWFGIYKQDIYFKDSVGSSPTTFSNLFQAAEIDAAAGNFIADIFGSTTLSSD